MDWTITGTRCLSGMLTKKRKKAVMRFTDQAAPGVLEECPVLDYRLEYGKSKLTD
ncbi:MAG: hypothetical protein ACLSA0_11215 [Eisenbergiella massiliensis]